MDKQDIMILFLGIIAAGVLAMAFLLLLIYTLLNGSIPRL